jgi:hypothetical protein
MKVITFLGMVILIAGCAEFPQSAPVSKTRHPIAEKKVLIIDSHLAGRIDVLTEKSEKLQDDRLRIILNIQNKADSELHIRMKTTFKDENFNPIGDETNWEYVIIPQHGSHSYISTSLSKKASKYSIEIMQAKTEK